MIKKHADSDLNDIIIISSNIFSLPFPNLHRVYTENYAKLIIISSSQGKQKLRKEPVKKKKKTSFKECLRHLFTKMVSMRCNYSSRGQLAAKRREKFKQFVFRGLKLLRLPARPCPSSIFPSSENLSAATRPGQDKLRGWPGRENYIATEIEASLRDERKAILSN